MQNSNKSYIAIFGKNEFEHLPIILWGWIRNKKIEIINHGFVPRLLGILERFHFLGEYIKKAVKYHKIYLGHYKGSWFEMSKESTDVTIAFYNSIIKSNNKIVNYYNRILNTKKFEAYIKKEISMHAMFILKQLHIIRLSPFLIESHILINKTPINNFIVQYLEKKYEVKYKIKWISFRGSAISLCVYYVWLFAEVFKRGIVFNKKTISYKLTIDAIWGFFDRTFRSDMLIDNIRFTAKDILMLRWRHDIKDHQREIAFQEAKKRGFDTVLIPKLKINIKRNIFNILFFYVFIPIKIYFRLFLSSQLYLFNYIFFFHKRCLPTEVLMNLYRVKCHISTKDWGDIEETIILNKYGVKNILFHWSDLSAYKIMDFSFIAHNVCYSWGDIHYALHLYSYFVDKRINIGCIYKEKYNKAVNNKENIIDRIGGFKKGRKTVLFCDTSFANCYEYTEKYFLNFLEIIRDFCKMNEDINILLKPKSLEEEVAVSVTDNFQQYKKIREELFSFNNFIYLDPMKYCVEEAIAISDVCVTLATTSPSTIALICGKNGLYFDNTGNKNHPFAKKYENIIVFEDKGLLLKQIKNILDGKFNCRDLISEKEIREFDAFPDDRALERLRNSIYQLTG